MLIVAMADPPLRLLAPDAKNFASDADWAVGYQQMYQQMRAHWVIVTLLTDNVDIPHILQSVSGSDASRCQHGGQRKEKKRSPLDWRK